MRAPVPATTPAPAAPIDSAINKASIIMMVLDGERSQKILSQLDETEIRKLSTAMAKLGRATPEQVRRTVSSFQSEVGGNGNIIGNMSTTEKMLLKSLPPERVAEIMDQIRGPNGRNIWEKLSHLQPQMLASYLRNEYPQTVAVVLAKLPAAHAAKVLRLLPERLAADVSIRLVRITSIQRSVVRDIEETLKREFISELARSYERDSTSVMAEMLNRSEKDVLDRVMAALEEAEPQAAARIRRIMFTFEDLKRVDKGSFGTLISECPAEKLPIALSGASPDLRAMFLSCMSERAANMLKEEMESMATPRKKVVEEAQAEIVMLAKKLSDEARIIINDDDEDEEGSSI